MLQIAGGIILAVILIFAGIFCLGLLNLAYEAFTDWLDSPSAKERAKRKSEAIARGQAVSVKTSL